MRKVILYIAMSLDGYIADKQGGVGWLGGDGSDVNSPRQLFQFPSVRGYDHYGLQHLSADCERVVP